MGHYLEEYTQNNKDFPYVKYKQLQKQLSASLENWVEIKRHLEAGSVNASLVSESRRGFMDFLQAVKYMCQETWATFDVIIISCGVLLIFLSLLTGWLLTKNIEAEGSSKNTPEKWFAFSTLLSSVLLLIFFSILPDLSPVSVAVVMLLPPTVYIMSQVPSYRKWKVILKNSIFFSVLTSAVIFVTVVHFLGAFSNSYIVHEDAVVSFLSQSLIWTVLYFGCQFSERLKPKKEIQRSRLTKTEPVQFLTDYRFWLFCACIVVNTALRLGHNFWRCREEQWSCETSAFTMPISAITNAHVYKNVRYFTSVICLFAIPYVLHVWLRHLGNLNGHSVGVICARYIIPLMSVCVSLYWAFTCLSSPVLEKLPAWQHMLFPLATYALLICCTLALFVNPLCIYQSEKVMYAEKDKRVIPQVIYISILLYC